MRHFSGRLWLLGTLALCHAKLMAVEVTFPDAALAAIIRDELELEAGAPIDSLELLEIQSLGANGGGPNGMVMDLSGLEFCTNLLELELSGNQLSDLAPLAALTKLTTLVIEYSGVTSVAALAPLTKLTFLTLRGNQIADLMPLGNLTDLVWLGLGENAISDLGPLSALTKLEELYVSENQISSVAALAGLTQLRRLEFDYNTASSLAPLAGLTLLEAISAGSNGIADLTPLSSLAALKEIYLYENDVANLEPLAGLSGLETLRIAVNPITALAPIQNLTGLKVLDIAGTPVTDLSPLAGLAALTYFDVSYTPVSDIAALASFTALEDVNLSGTQITSLSAILGLTNLIRVTLCDMTPAGTLTLDIAALEGSGVSVRFGEIECNSPEGEGDGGGEGEGEVEGLFEGEPPTGPVTYYVAENGADTPASGSEEMPLRSIRIAMLRAEALEESGAQVTVRVSPGTYLEAFSMPVNSRIIGNVPGNPGAVIIRPTKSQLDAAGNIVIRGGANTLLQHLTVSLPLDASNGATLLQIVDVPMSVENVVFNGRDVVGSIGLNILGEGSSNSLVFRCTIHRLDFGVRAVETNANITRNRFETIRFDAVFVSQPSRKGTGALTPLLGDAAEREATGFNQFSGVEGFFVRNGNPDQTLAEVNGWGGLESEPAISGKLSGNVDFMPFLPNKAFTGPHDADRDGNGAISLPELLRIIQFFNSGRYHCDAVAEDGYAPGTGEQNCFEHHADYRPVDWRVGFSELLRTIQFYNSAGFVRCPDGEDGFCPELP